MQSAVYYSLKELLPARGKALEIGIALTSNFKASRGQLMAQITAAGASAVQTLSQSNGPATSGGYYLSFNGNLTVALAYNSSAAQVQAALQALPNIGAGNVTCTGGPLPGTPIVITFAGDLANLPQNLILVVNSTVAGGGATYAVANTTTGVPSRRWVAYDGTMIAPPAVAPTVAGNGAGSAFGAGTYAVQTTYVTATGETTPSPAAFVTVTAAQNLRVSAIAGLNSAITKVNYYVNGVWAASTVPANGTAAQTDVTGNALGTGGVPPTTNSATLYSDGRQTPRTFLRYDVVTDEKGGIILASTQSTSQFGSTKSDTAAYLGGTFAYADLAGLDARAISLLGARWVRGDNVIGNAEILIPY